MPLGYLLIQSSGGESGAKERYLSDFLGFIETEWEIQAILTLTDKEWSEINACIKKFPDAKHQLCFWHCLRAIKTRLSILCRAPAFYNVREAMDEFPWIDKEFLPVGQMLPGTAVRFHLSEGQNHALSLTTGQSSLCCHRSHPTSHNPPEWCSPALSDITAYTSPTGTRLGGCSSS
jgi:hypothetical protein